MSMEQTSRRDLLRKGAIASAAAVVGGGTGPHVARAGLHAADQNTLAHRSRVGSVAPAQPRPGGTLRLGYGGASSSETLYPTTPRTTADVARAAALYDRLVVRQPDFTLANELAEEIEIGSDGLSYTIRLREGVEFHDGKTLGADDLIFSIREWIDPEKSAIALGLAEIDGDRLEKVDERTVRAHLHNPDYLLQEYFAQFNPVVVPVELDPLNPVGTGPFKASEFEPGVSSTFVRNENYWMTDRPFIDELVMTGFADESARINALVSGAVDVAVGLNSSQVAQLSGASNIVLLETSSSNVQECLFVMNVQHEPFDDPRVRAALRLIVDRQELVDQVYGGRGVVGNDMWAPADPNFAADVPQRVQDLDEARSLLEQAGRSDLRLELPVADATTAAIPSAEVFAEQARQAGVQIDLPRITVNEWIDCLSTCPFHFTYWSAGSVVTQSSFLLPGSPYDRSHWGETVPEFAEAFNAAKREPDDAKRRTLLQRMQEIHHESGAMIMWGFPHGIDGVGDRLGGLVTADSGLSLNGYLGFKEIWLDG